MTLNDLEQRWLMAVILCYVAEFGSMVPLPGLLRQSGERWTHTVCVKNVVQRI